MLHKERQCFVELRKRGKMADPDVLVRLIEVVAPIFSCGTPSQAGLIVNAINDVLCDEVVLPWDVSRAMSMEDRSTFAQLFSALLHLVRTSRSRAVLPFVEQHLLKVALPVCLPAVVSNLIIRLRNPHISCVVRSALRGR